MNLISIILYLVGVSGIIISLILTFISISKNNRISFLLIGCTFILSLLLIGSGTFITMKSLKSNNINNPQKSINTVSASNNSLDVSSSSKEEKGASIDDLKFTCTFGKENNLSKKNASLTIENHSSSIFNGEIKLTFTDSSKQETDTVVIPIKNLMPKSSYKPNVLVNASATNASHSFSGTFDSNGSKVASYTIKKITAGNNSFRFDVSVNDTSYSNLQSITNEFINQYPSDICNSFLIYFYPSDKGDKSNLKDAIADYFIDYSNNTSHLTIYNK